MGNRSAFRIDVTLMADPCLWRWDILDEETRVVLHSSWTDDWVAYRSREDAESAARHRLDIGLDRRSAARAQSDTRAVASAA